LKITLLCGGVSAEREVSLLSGKNVAEALRAKNYEVSVIDPAYGDNQPGEDELFSFSITDEPPKLNGSPEISARNYIVAVNDAIHEDTELVFIALHGTWGEDGKIQALLDFRGIPYTGSGVLASTIAMDKLVSKLIFMQKAVLTPPWISLRMDYNLDEVKKEIDKQFGYPLVVKPIDQGSTVGLTIVQSHDEIEQAIGKGFQFSKRVLLEMYVAGRELTVSILGNEPLPVIEIRPKQGFYDYKNKYTSGMTDYLVPAPLPDEEAEKLQRLAVKAFNALGCEGFGRVDFRMNEAGDAYCLEVNTIPGMTGTSLVPKAARQVGIEYSELCERIAKIALNR